MPVHSNDHTTPDLSSENPSPDSAPPFPPEGNAPTDENTPTRNPRKRGGFWGLSWIGVAALCLMVMMQLAACGSTDANDEEDPPSEDPPTPSFAVSPSEISYGEVDTEAEAEATFTITNGGDATLEGTIQVDEGSEHFRASDTGSYEVTAGSSLEVTVTFAPAEEAELSGALRIAHNADNTESPSIITLEGVGIVELADPPARP